jgi:hypothetical protein
MKPLRIDTSGEGLSPEEIAAAASVVGGTTPEAGTPRRVIASRPLDPDSNRNEVLLLDDALAGRAGQNRFLRGDGQRARLAFGDRTIGVSTGDGYDITYLGHKGESRGLEDVGDFLMTTAPVRKAVGKGILTRFDVLQQLRAQERALGPGEFQRQLAAQQVFGDAAVQARRDALRILPDLLGKLPPERQPVALEQLLGPELAARYLGGAPSVDIDALHTQLQERATRIAELENQAPTERIREVQVPGPEVRVEVPGPEVERVVYREMAPGRRHLVGSAAAGAGALAASLALADWLASRGGPQPDNASYNALQAARNSY